MFRKYEVDYNPKIDFKVVNLLNPKHDVVNNYLEKIHIFKNGIPYISEQGRWFTKIKNVYYYLLNNPLTLDSFLYASKEFESEPNHAKINLILKSYHVSDDITKDAVYLLREIWRIKPIGKYSYVLAVLVMNSSLKLNGYIPMIFTDTYNSFIDRMINENITVESLYMILSKYHDMSIKYVDKFDKVDKSFVVNNILNAKDILIEKYDVKSLWLFGSFVRNESTEYSDVDLYVDFFSKSDDMKMKRLNDYLVHILKRRVDMHVEGEVCGRFAPNGIETREVLFSV